MSRTSNEFVIFINFLDSIVATGAKLRSFYPTGFAGQGDLSRGTTIAK
jgi:hypothetical protein